MLYGNQLTAVSRERLEAFQALVFKWNKAINLVAPSTLDVFWERHIEDSLQVFHVKQMEQGIWLDIGSGGGFPGLVCAIMAKEHAPETKFILIESDQRKSTFLRTVIRELQLNAEVIAKRIEAVPSVNAQILSARALADLDLLLEFAEHHLAVDGTALLPKGASWKKEVDNAKQRWRFDFLAHKSVTSDDSTILEIGGIHRV